MIKGGAACLPDEVFNEGGDLGFWLHLYSIANNANKVINIKTMHNHMIKCYNMV